MNSLFEACPSDVVMMEFAEVHASAQPEPALVTAATDCDAVDQAVEEAIAESDAAWRARMEDAVGAARDEGREEAEAQFRHALDVERTAIAHACTSFAHARDRYFAEVERDVVKLALAIAARVLHREAAMDPTVLAGVVRVALHKVSDVEGAVLHTPAADADLWRRAMKASGLRVEADASLSAGEIQLKTKAGVAELGVAAQLVEVERGFSDLLAKRPA